MLQRIYFISAVAYLNLFLVSTETPAVYETTAWSDEQEDAEVCGKLDYNKTCCHRDEFQCHNGACIPSEKLCNAREQMRGIPFSWRLLLHRQNVDCSDASDELGCFRMTCENRTGNYACPHNCYDLPDNMSRCTCYKGYSLRYGNPRMTCEDINECAIGVHYCSQNCVNSNGSFACTCNEGFRTSETGDCIAVGDISVLYNSGTWIFSYNVRTKERRALFKSLGVHAMDYDPSTDILYWANKNRLIRSYIPGAKDGYVTVGLSQEVRENHFADVDLKQSIGIDWTAENLYWLSSDPLNSTIRQLMVSKLDGRYVKTLSEVPDANSIALDPENGRIYWAVGGKIPHIGGAWMNGLFKHMIVRLNGQNPICLTLDHHGNGRLYWLDSISSTIYYTFKDGRRTSVMATTPINRSPVSMDVFENYVYWVTKESNELLRQDKFGRGEAQVLVEGLSVSAALKIYHERKVDIEIRKKGLTCKKKCSHLCLHIPNGYSCTCPDGNRLVSLMGEIICDNPEEPPMDEPTACNCNDIQKICNASLPNNDCPCIVKCPDGHETEGEIQLEATQSKNMVLKFLMITVLGLLPILLCFVLSFYKRT